MACSNLKLLKATLRKSEGTALKNCSIHLSFRWVNDFGLIWNFSRTSVTEGQSRTLVHTCPWTCTFAEVFGIQRQAIARESFQKQFVAGSPAGFGDAGSSALHRCDTLEECRLPVKTNTLIQLRQNAVTLDFLFFWKLKFNRKTEKNWFESKF